MREQRTLTAAAAITALLAAPATAQAVTEIELWHAMGAELGERTNEIAEGFNESQDEYRLIARYRGEYTETMTGAVAAFRAGNQPQIVQVFEVGTATMMSAAGAIKPVFELMEEAGEPFDPDDYVAAVTGYYTDPEGRMLSMPFNSSTPVMWYNRDAFEEAGLDPDDPPATWEDFGEAMAQIVDSGAAECGFTTGWQSWVQLENFSAIHDVPFASNANGFESFEGTELLFNGDLQIQHIQQLRDWQEQGYFRYGGRRSESDGLFYSGNCAVQLNSSAAYAAISAGADFDFGVAELPYWASHTDEPNNSIIGGATLWTLSGHSDEEYAAVAAFFSYLSLPEVQAEWHQKTGYVPITTAAAELSREQGFYDENRGADIAVKQLERGEPTENSLGLRLGNFVQIRDVINEELENVWSGDKNAEEALNDAVERGNELLRRFERNL